LFGFNNQIIDNIEYYVMNMSIKQYYLKNILFDLKDLLNKY